MTFSCADAMAEVEKDFTSLPVETRSGKTVHLRNLLLLPEDGLKKASEILAEFGEAKKDAESVDAVSNMLPQLRSLLLLVADDAKALTAEMKDWPLGMYMHAIGAWQEATEMGEAQHSDG